MLCEYSSSCVSAHGKCQGFLKDKAKREEKWGKGVFPSLPRQCGILLVRRRWAYPGESNLQQMCAV